MADLTNGYVKLNRSILDWELFTEPNAVVVFLYCILKANHKESTYKGETVHRGELVTSENKISEATGLGRQQVRTALDKLIVTKSLTKWISPKKHTFIRVCEYEKFQGNQETNQPITNLQPTDNQPSNKNSNNINNINNNIPPYESNYIYNTRAREGVIGRLNITGATKEQMDEARASL